MMKNKDEIYEEIQRLNSMICDVEDYFGFTQGAFLSGVVAGLMNAVGNEDFLYSNHFKEKLDKKSMDYLVD